MLLQPLCLAHKVVAWATTTVNDAAPALTVSGGGLQLRRPPAGLLQHSDRGGQYTSDASRASLLRMGIVASMSRSGESCDNSVAEHFFTTIKVELIDDDRLASRAVAVAAIADKIERFYRLQRRHRISAT
jgi:putative transposase